MKPIEELVATAKQLGIHLWLDNGALRFRARKELQASPLFTEIKARTDEIITLFVSTEVGQRQQTEIEKQLAESNPELSLQQHWLWVTKERVPLYKGRYNQIATIRAAGEFNLDIWNDSLTQLLIDHEILRTIYATDEEGLLVASVQPPSAVKAQVLDCSISESEAEADINNVLLLASKLAREDINLNQSPLLRAHIFKLSAKDHLLTVATNHFVSDGFSVGIMTKEIIRNYMSRIDRISVEAIPARQQYHHYIQWQGESIAKGSWAEGRAYWAKQYAAIDNWKIPSQCSLSSAEPHGAMEHMFSFSAEALHSLRTLAKQESVGHQLLLISIFQAALFLWSKQEQFLISVVYHGRHLPEYRNQIGLYMENVMYPANCEDNPCLMSFIRSASECWPRLTRDGGVPARLAAIETGRRHTTTVLLNMMLNLGETANPARNTARDALIEFTPQSLPADMSAPPPLDLCVFVAGYDEKLIGLLWFRSDLLSSEGVAALRLAFDQVITAALSNPGVPLLDLGGIRSSSFEKCGEPVGAES